MLAPVILAILAFFPGYVTPGAIDPNCTAINPTDGSLVFAPSATGCRDRVPTTVCDQLFNAGAANAAPPGPGQPVDPNRVVGCFQVAVPAAAPSEDVKEAAIETCPNYCGFCCVTPEYNCANSPAPRLVCSSITQDMCDSVQWREIIAQDCPSACGFCLLGGCIDAAPDCATQPTICGNTALSSFVQSNCQRTCGLCTGSSTTAASSGNGGTGTCGDSNANCANWVRNGFCTNAFYSDAQKRSYCGSSCGLCTGK